MHVKLSLQITFTYLHILHRVCLTTLQHRLQPLTMSSTTKPSDGYPQFSFGSMALSDEPGRHPVSESHPQSSGVADQPQSGNSQGLDALRIISLNEHFCPEILPFQTDVVESIRALVSDQTDLVDEEEDSNLDAHAFQVQLKRMEIDRINYLLRDYFRVRIKKIERFVLFIFKDTRTYDLLSADEQKFAAGFLNLIEDHFKKSFLSMLPERVQILDKDGQVEPAAGPDLNKFVFCRVNNSVGNYAVGEEASDDNLDLNHGDILCIRYKSIHQLLLQDDVRLV